jgi:hypothetical protein
VRVYGNVRERGPTKMSGILEGLVGRAIWSGLTAASRRVLGLQIQITHPGPQQTLSEGKPLGRHQSFPVRGTLKRLPRGHEIWLLVQDEPTGLVWPQGFSTVQFTPQTGIWAGRINGMAKKQLRIIAAVAPPTSQDFFRYFQEVGNNQNKFEPLKRMPPECRNWASVQALIP